MSDATNRYRKTFYSEAQQAIDSGLLTKRERDIISRVGKRKVYYWGRHLRDLREFIAERKERQGIKNE